MSDLAERIAKRRAELSAGAVFEAGPQGIAPDELASRIAARRAELAPQPQQEMPQQPGGLVGASAAILNDIGAGLQGANPVAIEQLSQQMQPLGVLVNDPILGQYVDVDGVREPVENFPQSKFVTKQDARTGKTLIYPRMTQGMDVSEGPAASAGRLLGYGVISGAAGAAKQAAPATGRQEAARAAESLGITPSAAMQGRGAAVLASGLQANPFTASVMGRDAARVAGEIENAAGRAISKVGPASNSTGGGEALKRGADTFRSDFKTRSEKLYDAVDTLIPEGTSVLAPETATALRETLRGYEKTPEIASLVGADRWAGIISELESGNLTWKAARQLRSELGKGVGKISGPMANIDEGRLKLLYGKLSDDLDAVAAAQGPKAQRAWQQANEFYRAGRQRIDTALTKALKADTPEKAFEDLVALTKADSPRGSAQILNSVRKSLPEDDWAEVAANVLNRMGKATAGAQNAAGDVFSPATFLTNWNRMTPEAKLVLTQNAVDTGVRQELDNLAKVVEKFKAAKGEENMSRTGNVNTVVALLVGSQVAPVTTLTTAGATYLSARAMTSRPFLRALNSAARGDNGGLRRIAEGNGPLAIEAQQLLRLTLAEEQAGTQAAVATGTPR